MKIIYILWLLCLLILNTLSQVFYTQSSSRVLMTKNLQKSRILSIFPRDENIKVKQVEGIEGNQWEQQEAKQGKNGGENQEMNGQMNQNNIYIIQNQSKNQNKVEQKDDQKNGFIKLQSKKKKSVWNTECGNWMKQLSQQCDDGNRSPGDGCDHLCRLQNEQTSTRPETVIILILIAFLMVVMTVFLVIKYRGRSKCQNNKLMNQKHNVNNQREIGMKFG